MFIILKKWQTSFFLQWQRSPSEPLSFPVRWSLHSHAEGADDDSLARDSLQRRRLPPPPRDPRGWPCTTPETVIITSSFWRWSLSATEWDGLCASEQFWGVWSCAADLVGSGDGRSVLINIIACFKLYLFDSIISRFNLKSKDIRLMTNPHHSHFSLPESAYFSTCTDERTRPLRKPSASKAVDSPLCYGCSVANSLKCNGHISEIYSFGEYFTNSVPVCTSCSRYWWMNDRNEWIISDVGRNAALTDCPISCKATQNTSLLYKRRL